MKVDEMLKALQKVRGESGFKLNTVVAVSEYDAIAAHMLEALFVSLDDAATQADVDGVIDAMKWWSTFFHTMGPTTQLKEEAEDEHA